MMQLKHVYYIKPEVLELELKNSGYLNIVELKIALTLLF